MRLANGRWLIALPLLWTFGCADSAPVLRGQADDIKHQRSTLAEDKERLTKWAEGVDRDNASLGSKLAQTQQKNDMLEQQLALVREQLSNASAQLARMGEERKATEQKVQAMTASMQRQQGITITPNNSLGQDLPRFNVPDVYVRRDGDVIRVELPANRLFDPGNARLAQPAGSQIVASVAETLLSQYPDQIIGVEGHTDSAPLVSGSPWRDRHQLSVGRAMAVYDVLISQCRVPERQLLLAGHGANHPVVSNGTAAGKARNARVELVVYPGTVSR
jgi:flagellar motor protein MotB